MAMDIVVLNGNLGTSQFCEHLPHPKNPVIQSHCYVSFSYITCVIAQCNGHGFCS